MKKNILLLLTASLLILISCEKKPIAIGIIDCTVGMKLRKGPSMATQQIGYIPNRGQIKIYDLKGPEETLYNIKSNWFKVEYSGVKGWMFGGYVKVFEKKLSTKKSLSGIIDTKMGMKLRQGPSTATEQIGYIPNMNTIIILNQNGPKETIYGIKSKWYKIKFKEKEGWIFGGFVKIINNKSMTRKINKESIAQKKNTTEKINPEFSTQRVATQDLKTSSVKHCINELLKSYHGQNTKVIAISRNKSSELNSPKKIRLINTIVTSKLMSDRRFTITERQNLNKITKEQSLQQSGLTTKTTETGKIAGAELLLIYVLKDGILDFRIVETNTAHVLAFSGINLLE